MRLLVRSRDFDAGRLGCVRTKTLLLPMDYWEREANLGDWARSLFPDGADGAVDDRGGGWTELATVGGSVVEELVEALFLEDREAIVMFGAAHAETIALRLLTALWPRMRRTFSLCTLALAPANDCRRTIRPIVRSVGGTPALCEVDRKAH